MKISISTHERNLVYDLFGHSAVVVDEAVDIPSECKLVYKGTDVNISDPSAYVVASNIAVIHFEIRLPSPVDPQRCASYLGKWLYDRLSRRQLKKLVIEEKEVPIEEYEIITFIKEFILSE